MAQTAGILEFQKQDRLRRNGMSSKNSKTWGFKVVSKQQINWVKLQEDLSYANPIAFVTIGDEHLVMVHYDLIVKASLAKQEKNKPDISLPDELFNYVDNGVTCNVYYGTTVEERHRWVAWGKAVKAAPWVKDARDGGEVTVTLPTV